MDTAQPVSVGDKYRFRSGTIGTVVEVTPSQIWLTLAYHRGRRHWTELQGWADEASLTRDATPVEKGAHDNG